VKAGYTLSIENGADNYPELVELYRTHYDEMRARLAKDGVAVGRFGMRVDVYMHYWRAGFLINYVARKDGAAVGYCNCYLTDSMHSGERIAKEDAIYMLPGHRNGTGRKLARFVLDDLRTRHVKRLDINPRTDPRAVVLWTRLGFKLTGVTMTYAF
jgi:hypothetical protein